MKNGLYSKKNKSTFSTSKLDNNYKSTGNIHKTESHPTILEPNKKKERDTSQENKKTSTSLTKTYNSKSNLKANCNSNLIILLN